MSPAKDLPAARCRKAQPGDLDALMAIEETSFPGDRLSRRQMRYHLENGQAEIWVCADERNAPLAYLLAFFHKNRPPRLYSIAVSKAARGRGFGELLVRRFVDESRRRKADRALLEVRTDSKAAIALYEKIGFTAVRNLPGYYEDGCNGIKMMMKF